MHKYTYFAFQCTCGLFVHALRTNCNVSSLFYSFIQHWYKQTRNRLVHTYNRMCELCMRMCAGAQCPMSAWACIFVHDDDRVVKKLVHCLLWFWMWCGLNFQRYKHIQAIVGRTPIFCVLASVCLCPYQWQCLYVWNTFYLFHFYVWPNGFPFLAPAIQSNSTHSKKELFIRNAFRSLSTSLLFYILLYICAAIEYIWLCARVCRRYFPFLLAFALFFVRFALCKEKKTICEMNCKEKIVCVRALWFNGWSAVIVGWTELMMKTNAKHMPHCR